MNLRQILLAGLLSITSPGLLLAQKADAPETDTEASPAKDNAAEKTSDDDSGKFLPLPIVVTEPAIGEGLGAALIYFHANHDEEKPKVASAQTLSRSDRDQAPPPTATGVFGVYTNNDTKAIGIGHSRTFKQDRYRLMAAVADAKINATYYFADIPFDFSMEGDLGLVKLKRRFADSFMFVGMSALYLDADVRFFEGIPINIPSLKFKDVGLALSFIYDSRDDGMMPTEGLLVELEGWRHAESLGGSFDYWKTKLKINSFHTMGENVVLGLRYEGATVDGDNPFYAAPYVSLRGIPALRYQGQYAGVVETELRYKLARRWSVLGFIGGGFVDNLKPANKTEDDIKAWGFGARWLALPTKNVWVGLDLARGPEEDAYYIQLAHPW